MKKRILCVLLVVLLLCSCGVRPENDKTVVKVGGKNVNYDYYRYVFLNTRDDMDGGDREIWTDDYALQTELNDAVLKTLMHNRAIELLAEEYKVTLTGEQKKALGSYLDDMKKELGDTYSSSLKEAYLTEYVAKYLYEFDCIWGNIYDKYTDISSGIVKCGEEDLMEAVNERFYRIYYVMIAKDGEDAINIARVVGEKARGGEDFTALIREYGDDDNMKADLENGYYFVEGEIVEDVENEVKELEIGGISDIIDTELGYFIIKREAIDESYVRANYDEFESKYLARLFNDALEKYEEEMTVEYTDYYGTLSVYNIL